MLENQVYRQSQSLEREIGVWVKVSWDHDGVAQWGGANHNWLLDCPFNDHSRVYLKVQ
jgi:hypothetical protein